MFAKQFAKQQHFKNQRFKETACGRRIASENLKVRQRDLEQRGFTLLELLMALMLGAVLVTPFYIITRGIARQTNLQQMETQAMRRARTGMSTLLTDFQRAGMSTSPVPSLDPNSLLSPAADILVAQNNAAYNRLAAVHLNRGADGNDAVVIVGNFISGATYSGVYDAATNSVAINYPLLFNSAFETGRRCAREFNPDYAFLNMTSKAKRRKNLDVQIAGVSYLAADNTCTVTLVNGEVPPNAGWFVDGRTLSVAPNQAALYRVETPESYGRPVLMRYFIDYNSNSGLGSGGTTCTNDSIAAGELNPYTATVIADYVEQFQVWFRPVYDNNGSIVPVYKTPTQLSSGDGYLMLPPKASALVGTGEDSEVADTNLLSCESPSGNLVTGPQHLRSAIILLSVRTEKTDQSVVCTDVGETTYMDEFTVKAPADFKDGVGCYKLRTLVVEADMVHLATRASSFDAAPTSVN